MGSHMSEQWTQDELAACVSTYLWMLRVEAEGYTPVKSRINAALRKGPLASRSQGSVEYRFQNISSVLDGQGQAWITGYKPAKNVGTGTAAEIQSLIDEWKAKRAKQRVNWLVSYLPENQIIDAGHALASGTHFDYPDSTTYDVVIEGKLLPPKKVIGYAAQLFYGAPLYPNNFSAGDSQQAFRKLKAAGVEVRRRIFTDPDAPDFRLAVTARSDDVLRHKPAGNSSPRVQTHESKVYARDPSVVAFVEARADGHCELCGAAAPFKRPDGSPYLEVHHITPLSEGGPDIVDNAAALCPNCHRACHHGDAAGRLRSSLELAIATSSPEAQMK